MSYKKINNHWKNYKIEEFNKKMKMIQYNKIQNKIMLIIVKIAFDNQKIKN